MSVPNQRKPAPALERSRTTGPELRFLGLRDITYIATDERWLYLAAVIDLLSRQEVGWSMQPHMQTSLVKDALDMACFRRRPEAELIFYSDRGSQYCSNDFQDAMGKWQMRSSMSRKGNCCDNAPTESFWGGLKTASLYGDKFAIRREAMDAVLGCGWLSAITDACIRRSATSARCNLSNAATRYSAKRSLKPWAKNSTKRGQDQACDK